MIIGSACSKDYFGHDIEKILNIMAFVQMPVDEEKFGSWGGNKTPWHIPHLVAPVMYVTKSAERWWISKNKALENDVRPTSWEIQDYANPDRAFLRTPEWADYKEFLDTLTDADIDSTIDKLYQKWDTLEPANEFEWNVHNQLLTEQGEHRLWCASAGIAGYAIYAILKDDLDARTAEVEATLNEGNPKPPSTHQGAIGDRLDLNLTIVFKKWIDTNWGGCELLKMEDETGNAYTAFVSGGSNLIVEVGQMYHIRGTVKKHDEYKGTKQTILNRCKEVA